MAVKENKENQSNENSSNIYTKRVFKSHNNETKEQQPEKQKSRRRFRSRQYINSKAMEPMKSVVKEYENILCNLIPAQSEGYSLVKKIMSNAYSKERNHTIYHVWLNCLYNMNVTYKTILKELAPLLDTAAKKKALKMEHIFIIGHKFDDGLIRATGSCFILLDNSIKNCCRKSYFELDIVESKIHMIQVNIAMLRQQLRESHTLLLPEAFKDMIIQIPLNLLYKACHMPFPGDNKAQETLTDDKTFERLTQIRNAVNQQSTSTVLNDAKSHPITIKDSQKPFFNLDVHPSTSSNNMVPCYSETSSALLVKIGSKLRASAILNKFDNPEYIFIRLRCNGFNKILPSFLMKIFHGCKFGWDNIFTSGIGVTSVSGLVAVRKLDGNVVRKLWGSSNGKIINENNICMTFSIMSENDFRSSILNFNLTYEYQVREVSAKRKSTDDICSAHVSLPTTNISRNVSTHEQPPELIIFDDLETDLQSPKLVIDEETFDSAANEEPDIATDKLLASTDEFVPVTSETIQYALEIMKEFERKDRVVAVVFDSCFSQPNLNIETIRAKFEPVFGKIYDNCVLIKSNLTQLMPNLNEAYAREFIPKGPAYIIGYEDLHRNDMIRRANEHQILYGSMTMSCVIMSLKKGIYLMKKEALLDAGAPKHTVVRKSEHDLSTNKVHQNEINIHNKGDTTSKRNRIVASLSDKPDTKVTKTSGKHDAGNGFEKMLYNKLEVNSKGSDFVTKVLPKLISFGNAVIRVDNLAATITIHGLNLMMGTCSIMYDQVICSKNKKKTAGKETINIRIVMRSDNEDINRILSKDKCKTAYKAILLVRRTDLKELETFLAKNHDKICGLETNDNLPIKKIGYSECR